MVRAPSLPTLAAALLIALCGCSESVGQDPTGPGGSSGALCGNHEIDAPEECDDGSANSDATADACRTDCQLAHCGDGTRDSDEQCDHGASNSDSTPGACREDCSGYSEGGRPPIDTVLPPYFGFGVSSFGAVLDWPGQVKASHGIQWNFLYWYQLTGGSQSFLEAKLLRADDLGTIPVVTHYQLLERGTEAGYTGDEEWDIVIQAVQDGAVMGDYYDNVQWIMESCAAFGKPVIVQTEPDSTTWLRQFHTNESNDASQGYVAVAASGHSDLADLPDTIAGYAQALVRLRDNYAPDNVYLGLCLFDNANGYDPEHSVQFIESLNSQWDILFTHHVVKYSTKDDGWWDAFSQTDHERFLTWLDTITTATGLKYIHWQAVIGAMDYGLMPDYPTQERISALVGAGSAACLMDLYSLDGPPHSQPWHGFTSSPPVDHPAYNSLDKLAERLERYYQAPISLSGGN
ncbi:MAG: hypothetical protein DRI90_22175 [Deltaproteobacteria bacterium]|nr:MAG: hypothetical protein DRI90_22175 [Deltaproteobacteria bacterium]